MIDLRIIPPAEGAPVAEPVTLAQARIQLRIDTADGENPGEDAELLRFIASARDDAERYTSRIFTAGKYELRVDAFDVRILFPVAPVGSVESIQYLDTDGATQSLDLASYWLHDHPDDPALLLRNGVSLPAVFEMPGAVRIRFTGGHDPATNPVPSAVVQAILLIIGNRNENRADVVTGTIATELPLGSQSLLRLLRRNLGV